MTETLQTALIGAAAGLASGAIASLIAPRVNWAVEVRRSRRDGRRQSIESWRAALSATPFDKVAFLHSPEYASLRPLLSSQLIQRIESDTITVQLGGRGGGVNILNPGRYDEIARIERDWDLV